MPSILTAARDLGRLREIVGVLSKHGFGELLHRMGLSSFAPRGAAPGDDAKSSWPIRVRQALMDLGPCFIKLGQIASTRKDVLPPALVDELSKLQDDVEPISVEAVRREIELSLGRPVSEIFVRFDDAPLATASIGQVHRARLAAEFDEPPANEDGSPGERREREVVVKVQRPGVKELVERDLELLNLLAQVADRSVEELRTVNPIGMVQQFERTITAELDFGIEAQNGDRFRRNFEGHPHVRFPKAYRGVSSKRVLVLEFFDGKKLLEAVAAGFDGKRIAHDSVGVIAKMAFEDGFFHADPHPGNIIILGTPEAPVLGLIDLGMVGRLSPELRDKAVMLLAAAARRDSVAVADALYAMGRPTRKVDLEAYRAEASMRAEKHLGRTLKEIDPGALLSDIIEGATKFGIEVSPDFLMAGKALLTIDGIGKQLDPDLDILAAAEPLFLEHLQKRLNPQDLANDLLRGATRYAGMARDLPFHLREVLDDLRMGRLQVQTVEAKLEPSFDRHGRRLFSAIVIASLNVAGGLALGSNWQYRGVLATFAFVLGFLLFCGHVGRDAIVAWWTKGRRA